jgi:hypothetical protein
MPAESIHFNSRSICEAQNANFDSDDDIMAAHRAIRALSPGPSDALCGIVVIDYLGGLFQYVSGRA